MNKQAEHSKHQQKHAEAACLPPTAIHNDSTAAAKGTSKDLPLAPPLPLQPSRHYRLLEAASARGQHSPEAASQISQERRSYQNLTRHP